MSNKRADNKRMLGAWIDDELKIKLRELAKEKGMSMSELATQIIEEQLSVSKGKNNEEK
jgi:hypothetical protein